SIRSLRLKNSIKNVYYSTIPVLGIYGGKDVQVKALSNAAVLQAILAKSRGSKFEVHTFPFLNHLMQTAITGSLDEYHEIHETFNEAVMQMISEWILTIK
ncbi:MAG: hypothetical protein PSX81_14410, partial [bacterium]|nr:hypothetical protein [bacterium]